VSTLNNIGLTYCRLGDYSEAIEYYEKALSICNNLGLTYRDYQTTKKKL
jgi:tetratricopeptide (TPR) repeat protein